MPSYSTTITRASRQSSPVVALKIILDMKHDDEDDDKDSLQSNHPPRDTWKDSQDNHPPRDNREDSQCNNRPPRDTWKDSRGNYSLRDNAREDTREEDTMTESRLDRDRVSDMRSPRHTSGCTNSVYNNNDNMGNKKDLSVTEVTDKFRRGTTRIGEQKSLFATERNNDDHTKDMKMEKGEAEGDRDDDDDDDDTEASEALDGGWGYAVVLGTFVMMNTVGILSSCFGIIFLDFLGQLGTSSTMVALIFNAESFTLLTANLLGGPLTKEFGWRNVAMVGGVLISVGVAASAFSTSASFLFFSHSIVTGFGNGLCCLVSYAIIPHYFKRLRGRANGLMQAGICMGGILWPPVITYLQEQYAYKGTTLIMAAFLLNNCVAALVFHPVGWHRRKITSETGTSKCLKVDIQVESDGVSGPQKTHSIDESEVREVRNLIQVTENERTKVSSQEEENVAVCGHNENTLVKTNVLKHQNVTRPSQNKPSMLLRMKAMLRALVRNIGVLRSPTALIIAIGGSFIIGVFLNFSMLVPFAMKDMGYTQEETSWGISVSSICNLVMRLVVSSLADLPRFSLRGVYLGGAATIAVASVGFCFMERLVWLTVMLGLWGLGVGTCMSLYPLLLVYSMGLGKYMAILGVSGLLNGVWLLVSGSLFGVVRDVTGSYTFTICAMSFSVLLTILLFLFLPAAMRYDKKKEEEEKRRRKEVSG